MTGAGRSQGVTPARRGPVGPNVAGVLKVHAKKVWENPTVQEAAGVAQAQATKLYSESKDKLQSSKIGEKLQSATTSTKADDTTALTAPTGTI
jgi:hypothetical protein